jgi:long-chain acyl-CoA synthetase
MDTLVDLLREAVDRHPDRGAVASHAGLRRNVWTFAQLWSASGATARYLRGELGLTPGERVVVWAPNGLGLVALLFGAFRAGLVVVPIDPTATSAFVERVIAATQAPVVVTAFPLTTGVGARIVLMSDLPVAGPDWGDQDEPAAGDLAEIVFTSGTTGTPKGVMLTHRNIVANVEAALTLVPRRPLRLVSLLPLSHMMEQTVGLFGPLVLGSTIEYPQSRQVPALLKAMHRNEVTALVLVPQALDLMMRAVEREVERRKAGRRWRWTHQTAAHLPIRVRRLLFRRVLRGFGGHLDFVICGGAPLDRELSAAWERMGVRVLEGYGATECAPIVAANTYWDRAPGTVGRPLSGIAIRLSSDGEIMVRGPNVTPGYWENPAATSQAFDADGFYRTGDLGELDDEGRLRLTGRISERIVLASGLNVFPDDIETVLCGEPEIADCVVICVEERTGYPRLHAVVIPARSGENVPAGTAAVGEAVRRAGTRLAPHQRVAGVTVWPLADFPRTNLLKVKRHEVSAALQRGLVATAPAVAQPEIKAEPPLRLRAALAHVCGVDPAAITSESDLVQDLGLDSLGRVELAMVLEDELGTDFDEGELAGVATVRELASLVAQGRRERAPDRFPQWPRRCRVATVRTIVQRILVFPLHALVAHPFVVEGRAHLNECVGPVLVIANHASHLDTPSILRALPPHLRRRAAVAAAADYFYRFRLLGALASLMLGTFPFSRTGTVRTSLGRCGELVDGGWSVIIYPEGTRSTTGVMGPFRSGIGLLAAELGVPVVPVGVIGTHDSWPKGASLPRRRSVTVRLGGPIVVQQGAERGATVAQLELAVARLVTVDSAAGRLAAPAC